jgi:dCTP diphosphatase
MNDASTTVADLKAAVLAFSRERDWEQFHHPKDLGLALACEVGELLEHFRYRTDPQIRDALTREPDHTAVAHELADCLWLILRLGDVCRIDLAASLEAKLAEAAAKYPADLVRGKPDKYTAYQHETGGA